MRKTNLLLLLIGFLLIGSLTAKAAEYEYSYTFTQMKFNTSPQAVALDGVSWTLTNNGNYYTYDGTKGQQIGSENNPATSATLSTSGIVGTITSVKVNASGANGTNATMSITVGGENFTNNSSNSVSLTNTATEYTFTGEQSGDIVISLSQTSSKALYIKSITVSYYDFVTVITKRCSCATIPAPSAYIIIMCSPRHALGLTTNTWQVASSAKTPSITVCLR